MGLFTVRIIGPTGQSGEAVKRRNTKTQTHRNTDTFVNNIYRFSKQPWLAVIILHNLIDPVRFI